MSEWQPMSTAPRNGTLVRLRGTDAPTVEMRWDAEATSWVQPGKGLWVHPSGLLTWSEHRPEGAPEEWAPVLS